MVTNRHRKRALLIGIDDYPKLGNRHRLDACRRDVELMDHLLKHQFEFTKTEMLLDERATRGGILSALQGLLDELRPSDLLTVYYSGHGSQSPKNEATSEGFEETLVPYDSGRGSYPNRDISDQELRSWLAVATRLAHHVSLIFDCCHSGSIVRTSSSAKVRQIPSGTRPCAEPLHAWKVPNLAIDDAQQGTWSEGYTLVAACHANQLAYELTPEGHGALTFFLSQELVRASGSVSYRDIFERLFPQLVARLPGQHPQLEGHRDRQLFASENLAPPLFFAVTRCSSKSVEVAMGRVHGWRTGTRLAVYPPGTGSVEMASPIGLVELTHTGSVSSEAKVLTQTASFSIGCRAMVESQGVEAMQLAIHLDTSLWESIPEVGTVGPILSRRLNASPLLRRVDSQSHADVLLSACKAVGETPRDASLAPDRTSESSRDIVFLALGETGKLVLPAISSQISGATEQLYEGLLQLARFRNMARIDNPERSVGLLEQVAMRLMQRDKEGGMWTEINLGDPNNRPFRAGDGLGIEMENGSTRVLFCYILSLGLTGRISLLHPLPGVQEPIPPHGSLQLGLDPQGDQLEIQIPHDVPLTGEFSTAEGTALGMDILKVFFTSAPTDFSLFEQDSRRQPRASSDGSSLLGQLLEASWNGQEASRHIRCRPGRGKKPTDAWAVLTYPLEVEAPAESLIEPLRPSPRDGADSPPRSL